MTRMSDILKKLNAGEQKHVKRASSNDHKHVKVHKPKPRYDMDISPKHREDLSAKDETNSKEKPQCTKDSFSNLVKLSTTIYTDGKKCLEKITYNDLKASIEDIYNEIVNDESKILYDAYKTDTSNENYLISHSCSSCIYSIKLAIALGYVKDSCIDLGIAGLLHDIGMLGYISIVNKAEPLSEAEYETQQSHVLRTNDYLDIIADLPQKIKDAAHAHHERIDGSGYPDHLKRAKICDFGQIIAIIDVYSALIHNRKYRERFTAIDAAELLLDKKGAFSYKLIKFILENIGLFPVGSMIELNTGEKAEVIALNNQIPLRPTIKILYDAHGEKITEDKIFDLTKHQTLFISRSL